MEINFLEIAQIEIDEAIEYYNYEVPTRVRGQPLNRDKIKQVM